jgi:hypothetical protein
MNIVIYRILVAFGTKYGLEMRQIDFDIAYLNADIDKEIYMSIPDGMEYENGLKRPVVRIMKSIYGLKQAGRNWHLTLTDCLKQLGFKTHPACQCLCEKAGLSLYLNGDLCRRLCLSGKRQNDRGDYQGIKEKI